ncbi:MAG: Enoyl-CoA hydratase/carnithine racemase [Frankiales bacterium]|nr:Enoyl-CoA hydratase/carnithine racemase [Frankiales bacterium]
MTYENVVVTRDGDHATITMNRPQQRNALSLEHLQELTKAFEEVASTDATGIVIAGNGPVFSAGHDFRDVGGKDLHEARFLLQTCADLMNLIQRVPQVVIAKVHGLATAAGAQLVATCDLAVAADSAGFAAPGGKGGWFCHTPMVAIARDIGRKRAMEMALTGDVVGAQTALEWGLVNRVVPVEVLDAATAELLTAATRGSRHSKATGKAALYDQLSMGQVDAYTYAVEVMAQSSQTPDAQEGIAAFLAKRPPVWRS